MVNMLNILRWDGLCENVHGYYWYYRPVSVTGFSIGAAPVGGRHGLMSGEQRKLVAEEKLICDMHHRLVFVRVV